MAGLAPLPHALLRSYLRFISCMNGSLSVLLPQKRLLFKLKKYTIYLWSFFTGIFFTRFQIVDPYLFHVRIRTLHSPSCHHTSMYGEEITGQCVGILKLKFSFKSK
jgi:hypothetical protein